MNEPACKGCQRVVNLAAGELDRLVAEYFASNPQTRSSDAMYSKRLEICDTCEDLRFGTTCRHCGCFVAVRAAIAEKNCPAPFPKW